jgi:Flp pilus assembly CpaE family ATPase
MRNIPASLNPGVCERPKSVPNAVSSGVEVAHEAEKNRAAKKLKENKELEERKERRRKGLRGIERKTATP